MGFLFVLLCFLFLFYNNERETRKKPTDTESRRGWGAAVGGRGGPVCNRTESSLGRWTRPGGGRTGRLHNSVNELDLLNCALGSAKLL